MNLKELKQKTPADLLTYAEELEIENASTMRKQDIMFAILKQLAENDVPIFGDGVIEILQDGFGFLRSPEANYLPGPDDTYVSPSQIRRFALRTGDLSSQGSRNNTKIAPNIASTPASLASMNQMLKSIDRRIAKNGRKYHSGTICAGVTNGAASR